MSVKHSVLVAFSSVLMFLRLALDTIASVIRISVTTTVLPRLGVVKDAQIRTLALTIPALLFLPGALIFLLPIMATTLQDVDVDLATKVTVEMGPFVWVCRLLSLMFSSSPQLMCMWIVLTAPTATIRTVFVSGSFKVLSVRTATVLHVTPSSFLTQVCLCFVTCFHAL